MKGRLLYLPMRGEVGGDGGIIIKLKNCVSQRELCYSSSHLSHLSSSQPPCQRHPVQSAATGELFWPPVQVPQAAAPCCLISHVQSSAPALLGTSGLLRLSWLSITAWSNQLLKSMHLVKLDKQRI